MRFDRFIFSMVLTGAFAVPGNSADVTSDSGSTAAVTAAALQAKIEALGDARVMPDSPSLEERERRLVLELRLGETKAAGGPFNAKEEKYKSFLKEHALSPYAQSMIYGGLMDDLRSNAGLNAQWIQAYVREALSRPLRELDAFKIAWANGEMLRQSKATLSAGETLEVARCYVTALNILARQTGGLEQVYQPGSIISMDLDKDTVTPAGQDFQRRRNEREREISAARDHNDMVYYAPAIMGRLRTLFPNGQRAALERALDEVKASDLVKAAVLR